VNQPTLFDALTREPTNVERTLAFHRAHPEVLEELIKLTEQAKAAGRRKIGVKMLWERLRWTMKIERGLEDFKLNNNYHAHFARLIADRRPDLAGMFEFRELRTL
jgi:hypothetical protein